MRFCSVGLIACLAVACGGGPSRAVRESPRATAQGLDPATELAALLPAGAHKCAVSRPGSLSALRRSLYMRLSQGEPLAFLPDAPFVAVASAYRTNASGFTARMTLVRTSAAREHVRAYLDERSGLRLSWGDEEAPETRGAISARFVDEHTLRLDQGRFPESERVGAEARCLSLAARHRDAIEVASRRGELLLLAEFGELPRRIDTEVVADERHLLVVRNIAMGGAPERPFRSGLLVDGPHFGVLPLRVLAESTEESVEGRSYVERTRIAWEDLMLAREDDRRINAAVSEDVRRRGPRPGAEAPVSNLEEVYQQVAQWQAQMQLAGPAGERAGRELAVLYRRAIEAHPRVVDLRTGLFEVLARQLGDASEAVAVTEAALADGVGDAESFAQLRREGLAGVGAPELARALSEDRVVPRRSAARAAEAIVAARAAGADYAFAEAAFLAGRALARRTRRGGARRVPPVDLDLAVLPQALGLLAAAAGAEGALWIGVEGDPTPWRAGSFDAEENPRITIDLDPPMILGVTSTGADPHADALGRSLGGAVLPGPVVVSFFVVPFGGSEDRPIAWGRFEGTLDGTTLSLSRVSGSAAGVRWARVERFLLEPLSEEGGRIFPASDVSVVLDEQREVTAAIGRAQASDAYTCEAEGMTVSCTAATERPAGIRQFLVELAEDVLAAELRALVRLR